MNRLKTALFFALALIFICEASYAQQTAVSGKVTDTSGEPLIGAAIVIKGTTKGLVTDQNGEFSIKLAKGKQTLVFSYIGYVSNEVEVDVLAKTEPLNIVMTSNNTIEGVVVTGERKDVNVSNPVMGVEKLNIIEVKRMPALMGEVDILKAVQLLPGVQVTSEGSSGFSVRGGSPDQNLILYDNSTVYNASHLMGFFSVFNNDVVKDMELYKGNLPLKYGGRLSSLLDVTTLDKQPQRFNGSGGVGLISSRLMLRAPVSDKTSVIVGGRRSYADLFLKLSSDENLRKSSIYFYDLNAKILHRFSPTNRLSASGYYGKDNFSTQNYGFDYGNTAASLAWGHKFSDELFSNLSLNYSKYSYNIFSDMNEDKINWNSSITDLGLRLDFTQPIGSYNKLTYGASTTMHEFNPAIVSGSKFFAYEIPKSRAYESSVYLSNEQQVGTKLTFIYGLRLNCFTNTGDLSHTYTTLEPRAGGVFKLSDISSVKANYAHNTQFLQLANNSASGSPLDVWFSASSKVKPQEIDIYSVGYFHNLKDNMYETSAEVYYKKSKNVIDFADHASLILNKNLEDEVRTGTGLAYGIEFMIRKKSGKLTGFINYTISRSERTIPEINEGKTYLAPYDKPHVINVVLNYEFSKKLNVSANWVYATGNPTSFPTGRFEVEGEFLPIFSGRNECRKPDFHRLDLSLNYAPNRRPNKKFSGEWNFSVYNAYGRKNPWVIDFKKNVDTGKPYAEMTYLFGIVPSVTYNFKF